MSSIAAKKSEPKLCPTCWNEMGLTPDGYSCPRHGLLAPPAPASRREVLKPAAKKPAAPHAAPRVARQPSRPTSRLVEKREEILARNRAGESISAIAADIWRDLGYANERVCASKISRFFARHGHSASQHRPGPAPGTTAGQRFTPERLAELRAAIATGGSVYAFARTHWETWGFTSLSSCDSLLRKWLRTKAG